MSRPGFVLEVDDRTPPLVVHEGEGLRLETFPRGTRVVYPPEQLAPVRDADATIARALREPVQSEPLAELLRPGMRLTITFDDVTTPVPSMSAPDVRQRVVEQVLTLAAAAGVDDVELVVANGLHRKLTTVELGQLLGERVLRSFAAQGALSNHDAEDASGLLAVGQDEDGRDVEVNRRVAESDLVVHVSLNPFASTVGTLPAGLASAKTQRRRGGLTGGGDGGDATLQLPRVFTIAVTLTSGTPSGSSAFLGKREWEWGVRDQVALIGARRALDLAPKGLRHKVFAGLHAPYQVAAVVAGDPGAARGTALGSALQQQLVEVHGQSDVLVLGVPYAGPYSVGSTTNPVLAASLALGTFFRAHTGTPLVRQGGAVIVYHPATPDFHQLHHPSYLDFYEEVLGASTDPAVISERFEEQYATDPWYSHLYRTSHAYHGLHPFQQWYQVAKAVAHVGDVVWVGAEQAPVQRMGFRTASTLRDALEIVSGTVGRSPSVTYLHNPPVAIADVQ